MYMIYICDLTITKGSSGFGPLSHAPACALPLSYKLIFMDRAATYSPGPSPDKYHRPCRS